MKKILLIFALIFTLCVSCVAFASCIEEAGDAGGENGSEVPDGGEEHTHAFVEGKCECGEVDPDYESGDENDDPIDTPHEHSFVDGKCECGEDDPSYVPPHEHEFVDGMCVCGEEDPDYVAPHEHTAAEAVRENEVKATCKADGSYDEVVYCSACGDELSREAKTSSKLETHNFVDGSCSVCGLKIASEGLKFESNGDETCYVAGIGTCKDADIVIPTVSPDGDAVVAIGENAFKGCADLKSVVISNSVTKIGGYAFLNCTGLENVIIGNGVTIINTSAFEGCSGLKSVIIPDSVTSIESCAFYNCTKLTSITIPDSVTNLGGGLFYNTGYYNNSSNWENDALYIGKHLIKVKNTVSGTYLIKDGTLCIAGCAFQYCKGLTDVLIPGSVVSIGWEAFYECPSLAYINIPNSVKSIGDRAFSGCTGLKGVTIGDGVTSIGNYVFYGCAGLKSVIIPDNVTDIGAQAFYECKCLASVTLGKSVISIGKDAFSNCVNLIEVVNNSTLDITAGSWGVHGDVGCCAKEVRKGESKIVYYENYIFYTYNGANYLLGYTGSDKEIELPEDYNGENYEIYDYAFYNRDDITSVVISDSVTRIGREAFYFCTGLKSVTIGNSVTSIDYGAFKYCEGLTSVTIPNSVKSIGIYAFHFCTDLKSVTIGDGTMSIDKTAFYATEYYGNSSNWEHEVLYIGKYLIAAKTAISGTYVIKDGTLGIAASAFQDCKSLVGVTIPDSVISIGDKAFYNCSSLTSVTIPDSVTSIGYQAFNGCTSLISVTFENPEGWWYASSASATSGTSIAESVLSDTSTAATYLKSTYCSYYWKRS